MKKTLIFLVLICIMFMAFAGEVLEVEFSTQDIYGKNITDAIFEDAELTMINIWGTTCNPCISELPVLNELNKFYDKGKFQVIGLVADSIDRNGFPSPKKIETSKQIVKKTGSDDYLHIVPDSKLILTIVSKISVVPTTIFVDKNGKQVGDVYLGARSLENWKAIVDGLQK